MSRFQDFENKPIDRKKRDFIVFCFIGGFLIPSLLFCYFYYDPVINSDLPDVHILFEGSLTRFEYSDVVFKLEEEDSIETIAKTGKIKYRGFTDADWAKKGFRIELDEEVSLLGMRKDDDWLLIAMYLDFPRMRIKLACNLWNSLSEENLDPYAISPQSRYVQLYQNGEYKGIYLLMEKNDRRLFDLDDPQNNVNSSLIFQAKIWSNLKYYDPTKWEQDWPNEYDGYHIMDDVLGDLIYFIRYSSDDDFFNETTGIYSLFDKTNLLDFFVFNVYILHEDFWHRNYFIIRNTYPSKFFLFPWDYDASFGQYGWLMEDVDTEAEYNCYLYARLMNNTEFRQDIKNRWNFLRSELWTRNYILGMLSDINKEIEDILEVEMQMWKPKTVEEDPGTKWPDKLIYSTKEFVLEEYVSALYDFAEERLKYCDNLFNNL